MQKLEIANEELAKIEDEFQGPVYKKTPTERLEEHQKIKKQVEDLNAQLDEIFEQEIETAGSIFANS